MLCEKIYIALVFVTLWWDAIVDRSMHTTAALLAGGFALYIIWHGNKGDYITILIPIMLFAGMNIPDLDTSRFLKHRRTMHSLFAVLILFLILSFASLKAPYINFFLMLMPLGMVMHIAQDITTPSGCSLFYPFSLKKYSVIGVDGHGPIALIISVILGLCVGWYVATIYMQGYFYFIEIFIEYLSNNIWR